MSGIFVVFCVDRESHKSNYDEHLDSFVAARLAGYV